VEELLSSYFALDGNMSLQLHFLQSNSDFFPGNTATFSEQQDEKVPAGYIPNVKRCSRELNSDVLVDYCWTLLRETPTEEYKRQKTTKRVSYVTFIYF
jgi:hypothetical protein